MTRYAVVLAGGYGSRFWPLSTPETPKQFLPLAGDRALLRDSVDNLTGLFDPGAVYVVTGQQFADRTAALLPEVPRENILAEPRTASTAPALAWATWLIKERDPEAVVLSIHADWHIRNTEAFRATAAAAMDAAERYDRLVTVGIVPTRPDPGFGYIMRGEPLDDHAWTVQRFVEKPEPAEAATLIEQQALWNCGMFSWTVSRFFDETAQHVAEIAPHLDQLSATSADAFFAAVQPVTIDVGLLERSHRVAVIPATFDWDDVGTWPALWRVRTADATGNVLVGKVHALETRDCLVWADTDRVALFGVSDLVVAQANGITLVTTPEHAMRLKEFVDRLHDD